MDWREKCRSCFESEKVYYTRHAKLEMEKEEFGKIFDQEVFEAVSNGEVIEEYPEDKPYPSVLIYGKANSNRPLHLVCAYNDADDLIIVVTVYEPDPNLWIDFKERKTT
jgi:hypothetical protein